MIWKIVFVLLLVAANGFFVAAEFALVKIRISEIKARAGEGSRPARMVESIVEHLDAYLSACQLGITLASLGLGWVGEPLVAKSLEPLFEHLGVPTGRVHFIAFPLAFTVITFLHITAGEQVPKIFAIQRYGRVSYSVSVPLAIFYRIFRPFIWLINTSSNFMLRALGIRSATEHGATPSEDELRLLLHESRLGGHVTLREHLMIENVLDLEEKIARSCMLPRNQIVFIDREEPFEDQKRKLVESGHTRLPLCEGDLDHIVGMLHVKDVLRAIARNDRLSDLTPLSRPPVFFLETTTLDRLLREMQKSRTIMALLVDEFGVVSGLITLENILEELVGPIQDEFDSETPRIREIGQDTYDVDANCMIGNVRRKINIHVPPDINADTIGGLVMQILGHIPRVGEQLTLGHYRITVTVAEPTHVRTLRIEKIPPSDTPSAGS